MSDGPDLVCLSILMVSYNAADHLEATLRALDGESGPADSFEVLVTDNGSADRAAEVAERMLGASAVERMHRNTGFGFAVNRTAERARATTCCCSTPTHARSRVRSTPPWPT